MMDEEASVVACTSAFEVVCLPLLVRAKRGAVRRFPESCQSNPRVRPCLRISRDPVARSGFSGTTVAVSPGVLRGEKVCQPQISGSQ